jgi:riboflavin synthase
VFSGIVETTARILKAQPGPGVIHIDVERPSTFNDISPGDSISVSGICLTVESFTDTTMRFALAPETLKITGWQADGVQQEGTTPLKGMVVNLERSLRLNDRIHGHLVTGHVDAISQVRALEQQGETLFLAIHLPAPLARFVWKKGSVAINGVSLTVNNVTEDSFTLWLIPETLRRTNLGKLQVGSTVQIEVDNMARGLVRQTELK